MLLLLWLTLTMLPPLLASSGVVISTPDMPIAVNITNVIIVVVFIIAVFISSLI